MLKKNNQGKVYNNKKNTVNTRQEQNQVPVGEEFKSVSELQAHSGFTSQYKDFICSFFSSILTPVIWLSLFPAGFTQTSFQVNVWEKLKAFVILLWFLAEAAKVTPLCSLSLSFILSLLVEYCQPRRGKKVNDCYVFSCDVWQFLLLFSFC